MKLKYAIISLILSIPFSLQAKQCSSDLIDWSDYEKTILSIMGAYHNEDFEKVDSTLDCLVNNNSTFLSGKTGSAAAYWFFRKEIPAPGGNARDEDRIIKWQNKLPDSAFPKFANLRLKYSYAWNARGTKYANQTSEELVLPRYSGHSVKSSLIGLV